MHLQQIIIHSSYLQLSDICEVLKYILQLLSHRSALAEVHTIIYIHC